MGQQNSYGMVGSSSLQLIQELPTGKIYKQEETQQLYFLKQYAYTSQQAYQQAFIKFSKKLTQKNENILNLHKTNTKIQNTFCSTFYKIILVFEYINHSLSDEIIMRNKQNRNFEQKQIWSILFHCTLAIAHLRRTDEFQHFAISLEDIKLSEDGIIKILPKEMLGFNQQSDQNQGKTKKLAMTILSCMLMKKITNQSSQYLQALIDKTKCSKQLKKVLYLMIMDDTKFLQLQQYLFKLANDQNDSILSGVSTPVISSHKKTIKQSNIKLISSLQQQNNSMIIENDNKQIFTNQLPVDKQDQNQTIHSFQTDEIENPDQNQDDKNNDEQSELDNSQLNQHQHNNEIDQPTLHERQFSFNQTNIDLKMQRKLKNPQIYNDITVRISNNINNLNNNINNKSKIQNINNKSNNIQNSNRQSLFSIQSYRQQKQLNLNNNLHLNNNNNNNINNKKLQQPSISTITSTNNINEQQQNLYTDPKLLDLIKKDLQEISQKTKSSHLFTDTLNSKNTYKNQQSERNYFKQSINQQLSNKQILSQKNTNIHHNVNKQQLKYQNNPQNRMKSLQNIQNKSKQQQSYGNILDEQASFKKSKKSQANFTLNGNENIVKNLNINKQNLQIQSTQTRRKSQISTYNNNMSNNNNINNKKQITKPIKQCQSQHQQSILSQSQSSKQQHLQYVTQTYQKGQYKGFKFNGLRHGNGTFFYKQGGKYIGQWKQNKMNGKGTLYYPNNQIAYEGNWKDDQLHGYGTLYNEQIAKLNTSFQYQDWDNIDEYWLKYEGQFNMDNKEGKGKWYLSNGEVFEGHFKDDMVDGEGVLNRENGTRIRGIWRKNKLIRLY